MEHLWLVTQYKMNNEELDAIIDEWTIEWKVSVSIEDISHIESGLPPVIPADQAQVKASND